MITILVACTLTVWLFGGYVAEPGEKPGRSPEWSCEKAQQTDESMKRDRMKSGNKDVEERKT